MNTAIIVILCIPLLEIYLFIKIGSQIGAFNTISLILVTAVIGVAYARYEGFNTLKSGVSQLMKNELPIYEIISGAALTFAALLLIIPIALFIPDQTSTSLYGILLAITAGSITSGLGYTLWYWILPKINITSASISQLSVPLIAALGGYLFISETLNWQFYIASFLILGGIGLPYIYKK